MDLKHRVYFKGMAMSWGSCWLVRSAGAVLCVHSDEAAMEEVVQSVFSSAFLEGLPNEGWGHQLHT